MQRTVKTKSYVQVKKTGEATLLIDLHVCVVTAAAATATAAVINIHIVLFLLHLFLQALESVLVVLAKPALFPDSWLHLLVFLDHAA